MKLSVIVPVYNVESYIRECIDSVLKNNVEMQIILVDDGSSDNSEKICDEYNDKYDNIDVLHKENGGLSSARNAGLDLAVGDYVGFVDGDDIVDPNMFEYLYKTAMETQADIVTCGIMFFFNDDYSNNSVCVHSEEKCCYYNGEAIQYLLRPDGIGDYAVNKLYRRELFSKIRYPEGKLFEDVFTTYKVFDKANKVVLTNSDLYFYRYNNGSLSHNKSFRKGMIDFFYSTLEQLDFVRNKYKKYVPFAIGKCINAGLIVYRHYAENNHILRSRSSCNEIVSSLAKLIECGECSDLYSKQLEEAKLLVNNRNIWLYNFYITKLLDRCHNHPSVQKIIIKLLIRRNIQ